MRRVRVVRLRAPRGAPLPPEHHIAVEQGLLRTFGRVMPVLMPGSLVRGVAYAVAVTADEGSGGGGGVGSRRRAGGGGGGDITVNVPINSATGWWDAADPPAGWRETRQRWERFQGIRSWLLLAGFVLLCVAVTLRS